MFSLKAFCFERVPGHFETHAQMKYQTVPYKFTRTTNGNVLHCCLQPQEKPTTQMFPLPSHLLVMIRRIAHHAFQVVHPLLHHQPHELLLLVLWLIDIKCLKILLRQPVVSFFPQSSGVYAKQVFATNNPMRKHEGRTQLCPPNTISFKQPLVSKKTWTMYRTGYGLCVKT